MDSTNVPKKTLSSLARRYGTPLFVFSEAAISANVRAVRRALGARIPNLQLFYAVKANSNLAVLRTIRRNGVQAEIASEGELFLALLAGFRPGEIEFNGPAKTDRELELSAKLGLAGVNLDSVDELHRLHAAAKRAGKPARVSFRVRPDVGAGADVIQTGTHDSKFGVAHEDALAAYEEAKELAPVIEIGGIHAHVGSQNTSLASWTAFVTVLARLAHQVERKLGIRFEHLNLGGGLPATYGRDEVHRPLPDYLASRPSDEAVADAIASALRANDALGYRILLEPGRRIVAEAGVLVTRVVSTKETGEGERWLYVDAGFNILPSSRILKWYYEAFSVDGPKGAPDAEYRIAGPLCDGNDLFHDLEGEQAGQPMLPRYRRLPEGMADGHLLGFRDVGAYNLELTTHFNGRLRPGVALVDARGQAHLICRPETDRDLVALEPHASKAAKRVEERMRLA